MSDQVLRVWLAKDEGSFEETDFLRSRIVLSYLFEPRRFLCSVAESTLFYKGKVTKTIPDLASIIAIFKGACSSGEGSSDETSDMTASKCTYLRTNYYLNNNKFRESFGHHHATTAHYTRAQGYWNSQQGWGRWFSTKKRPDKLEFESKTFKIKFTSYRVLEGVTVQRIPDKSAKYK